MFCFLELFNPVTPLQDDPPSEREQELTDLKTSLEDTQPVGVIVNCCKTLDQVMSLLCQGKFTVLLSVPRIIIVAVAVY